MARNAIRFQNSRNRFQFWNCTEFRAIPCNFVSTQFPEFRTGITYLSQRLIFDHNSMREGEGGKWFQYGIPGIEWRRNWTESHGIPSDSRILGIAFISRITRNSANSIWFRNCGEFGVVPSGLSSVNCGNLTELGQWRVDLLYWMMIEFAVLDGTGSGAELIPQCSTSLNRMYSWFMLTRGC
jgi:hypothetical protein